MPLIHGLVPVGGRQFTQTLRAMRSSNGRHTITKTTKLGWAYDESKAVGNCIQVSTNPNRKPRKARRAPIIDGRMTFGKFRGKEAYKVKKKDPGYYYWACEKIPDFARLAGEEP